MAWSTILDIFILIFKIIFYYLESLYRIIFPSVNLEKIKGKVVLITGAGRGIGRATALTFAKYKPILAIWDINEESAKETAQLVGSKGCRAYAYKVDITDTANVASAAEKVRNDLGDVDVLVNNAGVMHVKGILELAEKEIRRTYEINTLSHYWTIREFLPSMLSKNRGHIVTISSMAGKSGQPRLTDYCGSKFAVDGMTAAIEAEVRRMSKTDIGFTTVYPLFVNTRLVTDTLDRNTVHLGFKGPNDMLSPDEVAHRIVKAVLCNERYVFIPRDCAAVPFLNAIFPHKALQALGNFLDIGFFQKPKSA